MSTLNPLNDEHHIKKTITNYKIAQHAKRNDELDYHLKLSKNTESQDILRGSQSVINLGSMNSFKGRNSSVIESNMTNPKLLISTLNHHTPMFHEHELPKDNKLRASMRLLKNAKHIKNQDS